MTDFIKFPDKCVSYSTFIDDIAARIVSHLKAQNNDPQFISQRKAFEIFGRRNVERWRRNGRITPYIRPGRLEYNTAQLRLLQQTQQDYFDR